ncbi:hypothetical protein Ahia01_001344700 [Argonauta hians]
MPGQTNNNNSNSGGCMKRLMEAPPGSTKLMSLCDLCSCWWNCMIFSESATMPDPFINSIPDSVQDSGNPGDIVTQPTSKALVPMCVDKKWQFEGGRVKSNVGFMSFSKDERKRMMDMKEERHKIKLEILELEREVSRNRLRGEDTTKLKLDSEEFKSF